MPVYLVESFGVPSYKMGADLFALHQIVEQIGVFPLYNGHINPLGTGDLCGVDFGDHPAGAPVGARSACDGEDGVVDGFYPGG